MTFFEEIEQTRGKLLRLQTEMNLVERSLADFSDKLSRNYLASGPVPADVLLIQELVSMHFGVPKDSLCTRNRTRKVAWIRIQAVGICRALTTYSNEDLARAFNQDRSTISHSLMALKDRRVCEARFNADYAALKKKAEEALAAQALKSAEVPLHN